MKMVFIFLFVALVCLFTFVLPDKDCISNKAVPVEIRLLNKARRIAVDTETAKLMLTNLTDNQDEDLFRLYRDKLLNTATLSEITNQFSVDVASIYFLHRTYQDKENKTAQDLYSSYLDQYSSNKNNIDLKGLRDYLIVFIPGLAYKEDTTTGANFARQRRLLNSLGVANELIETDEWGLSENNAEIISERIKELSIKNEKIILVSASKGGLEATIALGKILKPEETKSIKAWISVGGILRGSPLADEYLTEPKCWLAGFVLWTKGQKIDIVKDISYKRRKEEFDQLKFPNNIKIIHFVAVPLSTQINKEVKDRFCSLLKYGPNDGLTPIADEIINDGIVISEIGLDHYFRDDEIDKKTIALALVAEAIGR